jgi:site-specific DNA recombinase
MNAVVYCRKSTEDERSGDDGRSVVRQEELARSFAQEQGWRVAEVFKDEGISGAEFVNRPGYAKMIAAAKQKQFDVVVMMALNRLGRDRERVGMALLELHEARVQVWVYQGRRQIKLSTSHERLVASVEAFADEAYRESISVNTSESLHKKAKLGYALTQPPFGYSVRRVGEHSEFAVVKDEALRVIKAFELAAQGFGNGKVAAKLNRAKVAGPGGRPWSKEQVRRVVANRIYAGVMVYGKWRSVASGGKANARELVPEAKWVVKEVPHLRVVSDQLWNRVRAARAKSLVKYGVPKVFARGTEEERKQVGAVPVNLGAGSEHLLNQIARCGACRGTMSLQRTAYRCNKHKRGMGCTNNRGVPADLLEDFVRQAVHKKLNDKKYIFQLLELTNRRAEKWNSDHALKAGERASLERQRKEKERAVERLLDQIEKGQPVGERLKQRQAELTEVTAKLNATPVQKVKKASFFELLEKKAVGLLSLGGVDQVRDALRTLGVERIVVTPLKRGWLVEGVGDPGRIPPPISGGSDATKGGTGSTFGAVPDESSGGARSPPWNQSLRPRAEISHTASTVSPRIA